MRGGVIKSHDAPLGAAVLAPLELRDVEQEREAAEIVRRAGAEARERLEAAMALAQQAGHDKGFAQGLDEGRRQAEVQGLEEARAAFARDSTGAVAHLETVVQEWRRGQRQLFVEARRDVAALAVAIVRRIAPRIGDLGPAVAEETCGAALELLGRVHDVMIRVNPEDRATLERLWTQRQGEGIASLTWADDPDVGRGGARLESGAARIDARLSTQIDRIADEMIEHWKPRVAMMETPAAS